MLLFLCGPGRGDEYQCIYRVPDHWCVRVNDIEKTFKDEDFGGPMTALKSAVRYRDQWLAPNEKSMRPGLSGLGMEPSIFKISPI